MIQLLKTLENGRRALLDNVKSLNPAQFNIIVEGSRNNIIWNMGHILKVSEDILYRNADFTPPSHEFDLSLFARNTRPEEIVSAENISLISVSLLNTVRVFQSAMEISATGKLPVSEEKLQFLLFHEMIHYQTIRRLLSLV